MGEARRHPIERRGRCDRHALPDARERLRDLGPDGRIEVRMQLEIKRGELDLSQRVERRIQRARAEESLQRILGQRLARGHVR